MKIFKFNLIALILISVFSSAFSQTHTNKAALQWGNEIELKRRSTLNSVIGKDDSGIYVMVQKIKGVYKFEYTLSRLNNKMNLEKSALIDLSYNQKSMSYEFSLIFNNELYVYTSFVNRKQKVKYLFVQSIDKKTLQSNNDLKKVADFPYKTKYNPGFFEYEMSKDSSKLLVYYDIPSASDEKQNFGLHVFDESMTELWSKKVELPYETDMFDIEDYQVDMFGNVHLVGLYYNEKAQKIRNGEVNYSYRVLSYRDNGDVLKKYRIAIEGKFLTAMNVAINNDKDIICGGFYSDNDKGNKRGIFNIDGVFYLKIDNETQKVVKKDMKAFSMDFITEGMSERKAEKTRKKASKNKDRAMLEYELRDIIIRKDGGAVLVGEQFYINVVTYTTTDANGNTSTKTTTYYNYNDIICVEITPQGKIGWTTKIPKYQSTTNDGGFFSSFAISEVGSQLYFIYNDNPKNLYNPKKGKTYNFIPKKESMVVLAVIDEKGTLIREPLTTSYNANVVVRPKVCFQIDKKQMLIYGEKKKEKRFAIMTIR